jgi:hypothetical protein
VWILLARWRHNAGSVARIFSIATLIRLVTVTRARSLCEGSRASEQTDAVTELLRKYLELGARSVDGSGIV